MMAQARRNMGSGSCPSIVAERQNGSSRASPPRMLLSHFVGSLLEMAVRAALKVPLAQSVRSSHNRAPVRRARQGTECALRSLSTAFNVALVRSVHAAAPWDVLHYVCGTTFAVRSWARHEQCAQREQACSGFEQRKLLNSWYRTCYAVAANGPRLLAASVRRHRLVRCMHRTC
jgi:hypothetical protein